MTTTFVKLVGSSVATNLVVDLSGGGPLREMEHIVAVVEEITEIQVEAQLQVDDAADTHHLARM